MEMDPEMDDETIDMTDASDAEVLRVFKAMGDEDGIVIKKEGGNINLKDGDNEYMIQLGESYGNNRNQLIYEIEMDGMDDMDDMDDMDGMDDMDDMDDEMEFETPVRDAIRSHKGRFETPVRDAMRSRGNRFSDMDDEMGMDDMDDEEMDFEPRGRNRFSDMDDEEMDFEPRGRNRFSDMDGEEETSYELEIDEDDTEGMEGTEPMEGHGMEHMEGMDYMEDMDYTDTTVEDVMEAVKKSLKSLKSKGTENRRGPKFSYNKKPNMGGGFNEKRKEAFGKGIKATGTGKPKFEYKRGENMEKGSMKKVETKEASRTYGNGSKDGSRGLRKARTNNRNYEYSPFKISENYSNNEVSLLKEKNEEYKAALDVFRTKLNEVAVFNSNLAYATRLFTEHSTTKQEKINILRRFDNLESLKESKNLYRTIKGELSSNGSTGEQKINESIQRTVNKTADTGSSVNLIESKTYENPQFLRMKDLMTKIK
jgi:hypothetical protein